MSFPRYQGALNLIIVIATATVGVLTSIEGLRKPAELWISERTVYYGLLDLQRELSFHSEDATAISLEPYFDRMQALLAASREKWNRHVQTATHTGGSGGSGT